MRVKEVQVIPWQLADASYVRNGCMTTFGTKTVFVGSLHGMLTAEGLAKVLDDLFGGVVAATIDTGKKSVDLPRLFTDVYVLIHGLKERLMRKLFDSHEPS